MEGTEIKTGILLLIGVFSLSTSGIFVRLAGAPAAITAFYRLSFALVLLMPFVLFNRKNRTVLSSLSRKQWLIGLLSGLFLSIHYVMWFESLRYTSVASSTVLVTLQPIFSIILGRLFLKERLTGMQIAGVLVSIFGSFIIGWGDFRISNLALFGDILAVFAAAIISVYFFFGQILRKDLAVIPYSVLSYSSSVLFLAVYALLKQDAFVPYSMSTWGCFLGLAVVSTLCGQMIFNFLLKWVSATSISMSILGEPIGTCFLAWLILSEIISIQQGIGIGIVLGGLAVFFFPKKSESSR